MAGIIDRVTMIVKANVNDLLEKSENPERQLNYFILEMEDSIKEAENTVTGAATQAKMLDLQAQEARRKGQDWEQKAERALKANREDLAREALRMQAQADEEANAYQTQYEEQKKIQEQLRSQMTLLRQKYNELQSNKPTLLARYGMAKLTNKVYGEKDPVTGINTGASSRMERKIMAQEALSQMGGAEVKAAQTEAEINKLPDDDLDSELDALKQKMGLGKKVDEQKEGQA
jgi:phage shock protein A